MIRTSSPLLQFGFNQIVFLIVTVTRAWPDLSLVPKINFKSWALGSYWQQDHINGIRNRPSPGRQSTPELRTSGLMSWASLWTGWVLWEMGGSGGGTAVGSSFWVLADRWQTLLSTSWLDAGIWKSVEVIATQTPTCKQRNQFITLTSQSTICLLSLKTIMHHFSL